MLGKTWREARLCSSTFFCSDQLRRMSVQVNRLLLPVNNAVNYRNGKIGMLIFLICGMGGKSDEKIFDIQKI